MPAIAVGKRMAQWLKKRPWFLNAVLGMVAGLYTWEFLSTNQDFTGPQDVGLPLGLAPTFLVGPLVVLSVQALSALVWARLSGRSFHDCLYQDALSLLPLGLLGLSPLVGLLIGLHSTAYNAGVVVLVSLTLSACLALKTAAVWALFRNSPRCPHLSDRTARWILVGVIVAYALIFITLQVSRYNAYQLWGVDHTRVTQGLWNTLHGRFLRFTFVGGTDINLLSDHFELVYLLFVPLYWLWPDPRLPLIVQTIVLALAAWPLYHIARRWLHSPALALGWALVYLVFPMIVTAAQDSAGAVRPDTLAIPVFIFMLDALDRKNWGVFALTVILAFISKQYLSLLVAMLGLYVAVRRRQKLFGLALSVVGVLWFVAIVQWVMPAIRGGPNLTLAVQYGSAAGESGIVGLVQLLLQEPSQFLARALSPNQFLFWFFIFFSLGGLPLFDPAMAAVGLPVFAIFALALPVRAVNLGNHHYYPVLPFFFTAAIDGVAALKGWIGQRIAVSPQRVAAALTAFTLGMSFLAGFFWVSGPWSWSFWDRRAQTTYWATKYMVGEHTQQANEFVRLVPPEVPVLASDYLLAHLANRPQLYHFFWPPDDVLERVDYVVVDLLQNHVRTPETMERERVLLDKVLSDPDFALRAYEDGLLFFEREATGGYTSTVEILVDEPHPSVSVERDLGERLRLLGYDPPVGSLHAGERVHVTYYWQVLEGFAVPFEVKLGANPESVETHQTDYVLADRFIGADGEFSVLHLPTYVQLPPAQWQSGQIIRETYDFCLPADVQGEYDWSVGLYAVPRFLGVQVNAERQLSDIEPLVLGRLGVQP